MRKRDGYNFRRVICLILSVWLAQFIQETDYLSGRVFRQADNSSKFKTEDEFWRMMARDKLLNELRHVFFLWLDRDEASIVAYPAIFSLPLYWGSNETSAKTLVSWSVHFNFFSFNFACPLSVLHERFRGAELDHDLDAILKEASQETLRTNRNKSPLYQN